MVVSVADVPWVCDPPTPVIVSVLVPSGMALLVVTDSVDVVVAGAGVNVPDAPVGRPLTERATEPLNPLEGVMVTVYVVADPGTTLREDGLTESVKSCPMGAPTALAAFSRPPVIVFPARLEIVSVLSRIALFTCAVVILGVFASTSAATPETCGVAMDVPLRYWYVPPG